MIGGVLVVSRQKKLYEYYKKRLMGLGYRDITFTSASKEALNTAINEVKPRLMIIGAGFYQCSTPFMIGLLLERFPHLNIAAVAILDYPADYMMDFITYGVKSALNKPDGIEQFDKGLETIRVGKNFISETVQERIDLRSEMPERPLLFSPQQFEIVKLICNCFNNLEIADLLGITDRTVYNQKNKIYAIMNVTNEVGILRAALTLGLVNQEDLIFVPTGYISRPKPEKLNPKKQGRSIYLVKGMTKPTEKKQCV